MHPEDTVPAKRTQAALDYGAPTAGPTGGGASLGCGQGLGSGRLLWGLLAAGAVTSLHDWVFMNERNPVRE